MITDEMLNQLPTCPSCGKKDPVVSVFNGKYDVYCPTSGPGGGPHFTFCEGASSFNEAVTRAHINVKKYIDFESSCDYKEYRKKKWYQIWK